MSKRNELGVEHSPGPQDVGLLPVAFTLNAKRRSRAVGGSYGLDSSILAEYVPEPWKVLGLCRSSDSETFFSTKNEDIMRAIGVCAACPVQVDCLEYAINRDCTKGVWGGVSERGIRLIKKERKAAKQSLSQKAADDK